MTVDERTADVLVVGSGIAGCSAALAAAREGDEVFVVTKAERPADTSTERAQGGVATTRYDPERLAQDVVAASGGTADAEAVDVLVQNADAAVEDVLLETLGVPFDRDGVSGSEARRPASDADFDYAREAAHSTARILHVDASTGEHVLRPFLNHLDDHERVTVLEGATALELVTREGEAHGAVVDDGDGVEPIFAGATVLATGGIGACYGRSTNPAGATGDGVAMAALSGADVAEMAYVQFHPTAYAGEDSFLVSEAVRGEGALLRNGDDERFMPDYHADAELAPRDVVARAVAHERERTGEVVLDVGPVGFAVEFPGLATECEARGVDPADGIPVAPSEHFLCGGVAVDDCGRTSLHRLYAVGECARTGVHGANRLASTSLLEGLVWGLRAGEAAAGNGVGRVEPLELRDGDPDLPPAFVDEKFARLRRVMDECVGLRRTPDDLRRARGALRRLKGEVDAYVRTRTSRELYELRNASVTALLVARAAAESPSVGCHHVEAEARAGD